jgi:hypothetical protein
MFYSVESTSSPEDFPGCGHQHETMAEAMACIQATLQEARTQRPDGSYSGSPLVHFGCVVLLHVDSRTFRMDGEDEVSLPPANEVSTERMDVVMAEVA